jgi:hypothetical protein
MEQTLDQIPQSALQTVHSVGLAETRQPKSSALRTARVGPQVKPEGPRHLLLALAHAALKDRQIGKAFDQRTVDPPHLASAVYALSHWVVPTML